MATWNSRGLRGSTLEEFINHTNERYTDMGLALIQKIPTPITPVQIDQTSRHITLAYFDKISTVDYIGAVQGIPVCFDAKECRADTFPLQNIHDHQMDFMDKFEKQGGISFLLIYYTSRDELYYMSRSGNSGTAPRQGAERASGWTSWIPAGLWNFRMAISSLILILFKKIWTAGIDRAVENPYNDKSILAC